MARTRRRLLAGLAAGTVASVAGCLGGGDGGDGTTNSGSDGETTNVGGGDRTSDGGDPTATATPTTTGAETTTAPERTPVSSLDGPVATAPIPEDPGSFTYATMGPGDAPEVVYFGNWKCPYCAQFSSGSVDGLMLPTIVEEYVRPGDVRLTYRCLAFTSNGPFLGPDAPRAARAGLLVWEQEPGAYWPFHEAIMVDQPPESQQWATTDRLVEFARQAGVDDLETLRRRIEAGDRMEDVRANTQAANEAGVTGTPTLVAGGETASPFRTEQARSLIESLL